MSINTIYYVETNLICIVILLLFRSRLWRSSEQGSSSGYVFILLLWSAVLLCFADMTAGLARGKFFWGARAVIELSNIAFYEMLTVSGYLWLIYVYIKLKTVDNLDKKIKLWSIPLLIFTAVALSNPITHILFSITDDNLFVRGPGTYLHWIISWVYMIVPTLRAAYFMFKEKNKLKRGDIAPLLYFIVPTSVAGTVQMLFYGVTCTQVGVTVSVVLVSLFELSNRVMIDSLTGLNNRHSFSGYIDGYLPHGSVDNLTLMMIDINRFKQVNDRFGHIEGDHALSAVADALKKAAGRITKRVFVCRYGGDEFLIAAVNMPYQEILSLTECIHKEIDMTNNTRNSPYSLSLSIGWADGKCADYSAVQQLLHDADLAMYKEKRLYESSITASA